MFNEYLKNRNVRIGLWIFLGVVIVGFMWLTAPKDKGSLFGKSGDNVNAYLDAPAATNQAAATNKNTNAAPPANTNKTGTTVKRNTNTAPKGFVEKRTPHFVSATIANNATLTNKPSSLTITFDAPVIRSTDSFVRVQRDQVYSAVLGSSFIGGDGKTLSVNLNQNVQNGDYYVYYVACFADVGCKDGRFGYHLKTP